MEVRTGIAAGQGLGDTIANFTHLTGIDKLASKYEQITSVPCGCNERQEKLNELFPQPVGLII